MTQILYIFFKQSRQVGAFRDECLKNKEKIEKEQEEANNDLQAALPYLREAEEAVKSITPKDIGELKSMKTPSDIIRLVFDGVLILLQNKLVEVRPEMKNINKKQIEFIHDSFDESAKAMMADVHFLSNLFDFSQVSSSTLPRISLTCQNIIRVTSFPSFTCSGRVDACTG